MDRALVVVAGFAALAAARAARADDTNWATKRAAELVVAGGAEQSAGRVDEAVNRYRDAIAIDPTYGQAYLDLGALRTATGDPDEAEATYSTGIEHVLGFTAAYVARAGLRLGEGRKDAAIADLLSASKLAPADTAVANKLCEAAIGAGKLPLALATARKLAALAAAAGDADLEKSARLTVRALAVLLGDIDPVAAGSKRGPVRRALAATRDAKSAKSPTR